jgi:hypothetical protein
MEHTFISVANLVCCTMKKKGYEIGLVYPISIHMCVCVCVCVSANTIHIIF